MTGLLECDAAVTVISTDLSAQLRLWAEGGTIAWIPRSYQHGDLQGAHLVIVTDSSPTLRAAIHHEAETQRVLLNVMDDASHSNFTTGAVMRQGALTIAISTSGCAPALAVRLRQQLEHTFGPEYALFLDWLRTVREPMAAQYPNSPSVVHAGMPSLTLRSSPGSSRAVSTWPANAWQKSSPTP